MQDHARAAFWWRKAGVDQGDGYGRGVHLAECYWRLGNKQMAVALIEKLPPQFEAIKLWADMGEPAPCAGHRRAEPKGPAADVALIYAGDACRVAGQYQQALQYYEQLLALPVGHASQGPHRAEPAPRGRQHRGDQALRHARLRRVPDGTYRSAQPGLRGRRAGRGGRQGGRIESVRVTEHREKQFYSSMTDTPRKIIEKQGVKGIDATSGATITSEAIINATAKALSGAMKPE